MPYSFDPIIKKWQSLVRDFVTKAQHLGDREGDFLKDTARPIEQLKDFFDGVEPQLELLKEDVKNLFLLQFQLQEMMAEEIKNAKLERLQAEIEDFETVKKRRQTMIREREAVIQRELEEKERAKAKLEEVQAPGDESKFSDEMAAEAPAQEHAPDALSKAADDKDQEVSVSDELMERIEDVLDRGLKERPEDGLLGYMDYSNWFYQQNRQTQKDIMSIFCSDPRLKPEHMLFKHIDMLPPTMAGYLWRTANILMKKNHDDFAVKLLIKGLTIVTDKVDKEMIHIIYAKYFYRQRKNLEGAYDGCINHCEKAIKSFLSETEERDKPVAPFKLLTQIYEEQQKFERILDVCDRAIKLYSRYEPKRARQFMKIKKVLEKKLDIT